MIKFEDKYVHFRWTNELEGKMCFVADDLEELHIEFIQGLRGRCAVTRHESEAYPFETEHNCYRFCYYDPNLECKIAFEEGKKIQFKSLVDGTWCDCSNMKDSDSWDDQFEYRVKPTKLEWQDLKIGDVIETFEGPHRMAMVTEIDFDGDGGYHIYAADYWYTDEELEDWRKVN